MRIPRLTASVPRPDALSAVKAGTASVPYRGTRYGRAADVTWLGKDTASKVGDAL